MSQAAPSWKTRATYTFLAWPSDVGGALTLRLAPKSIQRQSISVGGFVAGQRSIVR